MRIELQRLGRPYGSGSAGMSSTGIMVVRILLLTPGVFLTLRALAVYPLLDSRAVMGVMLCGYLLPAVLQVASFVNSAGDNGIVLRSVFGVSSIGLVLLGVLLLVNGSLDRSPAGEAKATVLDRSEERR